MFKDHPLGIGEGNFTAYVGVYNPDIQGKDAHSTPLRCLAELGVPGFTIYLLMIANAFLTLRRLSKNVSGIQNEDTWRLHIYGQFVALVIFLFAGLFITHTYIEELYWLLMMPFVLERIFIKSKSLQQQEKVSVTDHQISTYAS